MMDLRSSALPSLLRSRLPGRGVVLCVSLLALTVAGCSSSGDTGAGGTYRPTTTAGQGSNAPGSVTVQRGDTVYAISRRYGIPVKGIIEANRLSPPYGLQVGQTLVLPRADYVVQRGDTLYGIARATGVDAKTIASLNGLNPPYSLQVGQTLALGGSPRDSRPPAGAGAIASAPPVQAAPAQPVEKTDLAPPPAVVAQPAPPPPPPPPPPAQPSVRAEKPPEPPARTGKAFSWPVQGKVVSGFGPVANGTRNDGINISVPVGTPVKAAESGVVVYADSGLKGFGNLLLIKHDGGWMTAYAHNDTLLAKRGQTVKRGQVIAKSGRSGGVDSPQVHFELRKGTQAVNPLEHLAPAG